mmetsp:Transcript_2361/g.4528  ORF Transcript_2361/g.4528 Transcript_2361/m.4528 type:complete len:312 (+) Transcript_2361:247-1182(+)
MCPPSVDKGSIGEEISVSRPERQHNVFVNPITAPCSFGIEAVELGALLLQFASLSHVNFPRFMHHRKHFFRVHRLATRFPCVGIPELCPLVPIRDFLELAFSGLPANGRVDRNHVVDYGVAALRIVPVGTKCQEISPPAYDRRIVHLEEASDGVVVEEHRVNLQEIRVGQADVSVGGVPVANNALVGIDRWHRNPQVVLSCVVEHLIDVAHAISEHKIIVQNKNVIGSQQNVQVLLIKLGVQVLQLRPGAPGGPATGFLVLCVPCLIGSVVNEEDVIVRLLSDPVFQKVAVIPCRSENEMPPLWFPACLSH